MAWRISLGLWVFGGVMFLALAFRWSIELVQAVDSSVWRWVVSIETDFGVVVAKVLDFVGSSWVVAPIIVVVGVLLAYGRHWERLMFWVSAMISSQLLIGPMKSLYGRPRPPAPLVDTSHFSFPSGHAIAGAAVAISLVIVVVPAGPKRLNLEVLAGLFALLMALSRVYLRAHWISDVVAGAALGAAVAIGVAALVHFVEERRGSPGPI